MRYFVHKSRVMKLWLYASYITVINPGRKLKIMKIIQMIIMITTMFPYYDDNKRK